jgi:hypothetical protein
MAQGTEIKNTYMKSMAGRSGHKCQDCGMELKRFTVYMRRLPDGIVCQGCAKRDPHGVHVSKYGKQLAPLYKGAGCGRPLCELCGDRRDTAVRS